MKIFTDFDEAHDALQEGEMVCGVATDPPKYFHAPRDVDDLVLREMSHEAWYGVPMDLESRKALRIMNEMVDLRAEPAT